MSETVVEFVKRADTSAFIRKPLEGTGAIATMKLYGSQRDDDADLMAFLPTDPPASERFQLPFRKCTEDEIREAGMQKVGDDDKISVDNIDRDCEILQVGLPVVHVDSPTESKLTEKAVSAAALEKFEFSPKYYQVVRDKVTGAVHHTLNFRNASVKRKYSQTLHQRFRAAAKARGLRWDDVAQVTCTIRGETISFPEWPKEAFKPKTTGGKAKATDDDDVKMSSQEEDAEPPKPPPGLVPKSETQKRKAEAPAPAKSAPPKKAKEAKEAPKPETAKNDAKAALGRKTYEWMTAFKAAYPNLTTTIDEMIAYARKTAAKPAASRIALDEDDFAGKSIDELIAHCQNQNVADKAKQRDQMLKLKYTLTVSNLFLKDIAEPPPPPPHVDLWDAE